MIAPRSLFTALALTCALPCASAAELAASVDRAQVNAGETLELTLQTDDVTQFGKPDFTALNQDFEVRDTRQVNQLATLDGHANGSGTRWIVTLLPRHTGTLDIPALHLGELASQALSVQVLPADSGASTAEAHQPVFIDSQLDSAKVYVQAQAVLTLRIYHSVALYDDSRLSEPNIPDVRVVTLGAPRTYEKDIDGVRHGVIEYRYALYPQRSGAVQIPAQGFDATAANTDRQGAARPGEHVHLDSPAQTLDVLPQPDSYPAGTPWLPARSLTLSEQWAPDSTSVQVGDSLTRTITLQAEGLSGAQLPPLPALNQDNLRQYTDQPQVTDLNDDRGLAGQRQERSALVPQVAGPLDIPAIDVVWWNTREDHLEHTSLPARSLQVADLPGHSTTPDAPAPVVREHRLWPWQLATGCLALTTLLGFGLWWRARRQPAVQRAAPTGPSPRSLLDDLKRATQANDPQATRQALDAWARQQPETLAEMAARFVPLSDALDGLNGALYSESGQYWQGQDLWQAIGAIPQGERSPAAGSDSLPPLYPK